MRELVVIRHLPGDRWDPLLGYKDQPGIDSHVAYWSTPRDAVKVVAGGPFPDGSGGMFIVEGDMSSAKEIALRDPAVVDQLLYAEIRLWRVVLETR